VLVDPADTLPPLTRQPSRLLVTPFSQDVVDQAETAANAVAAWALECEEAGWFGIATMPHRCTIQHQKAW
jgi:hypothetical protein